MVDKLTKLQGQLKKANELQDELSSLVCGHLDNIEKLKQDRIDKKEERQTALAYGENVSKLTNAINRIDSKIEESEDALVGIKQRQAGLKSEINKLEQEIVRMELEVDKAKLWKVARKYNEKARELSEIVRDFWDLYDHVDNYRYDKNGYRWNFSSGIHCDNFYDGALHRIPFFRIGNENPRHSTYINDYLFELGYYRSSERKKRKEQEAKQVAETVEETDDSDELENEESVEDNEYSDETGEIEAGEDVDSLEDAEDLE